MAAFMLARVSVQKAGRTLFYVQAVDQPVALIQLATEQDFYEKLLKISSSNIVKRLPGAVFWHQGMRMQLATALQQPFVFKMSNALWSDLDRAITITIARLQLMTAL